MRRTDRLFDLIQILRDGRLHRAAEMAAALGVTTRTIWRDITSLQASGMPVEGERGVGYILRAPITLPPMMLNPAELEVLRRGIRLVAEGTDAGLARSARALAARIAAVTPAPEGEDTGGLFALSRPRPRKPAPHLPMIRRAIRARERLTISYFDLDGRESHRDIRPLQLDLTGRIWTLAAWCEARGGFRSFRLDRVVAVLPTGEGFPDDPDKGLAAWRATGDG